MAPTLFTSRLIQIFLLSPILVDVTAAFGVVRQHSLLQLPPSSSSQGSIGNNSKGRNVKHADHRVARRGAFQLSSPTTSTTSQLTRLHAASTDNQYVNRNEDASSSSSSPPRQQNQIQLIQSWLLTHVPTIPPSDLQSYVTYLYDDGFTTLEKLNSINTNNERYSSDRMEDLYFMKKGHRRVLMKKIGIMRNTGAMMMNNNMEGMSDGSAMGERNSSNRMVRQQQQQPASAFPREYDASSRTINNTNERKDSSGNGNVNANNKNDPFSPEEWIARQDFQREQRQQKQQQQPQKQQRQGAKNEEGGRGEVDTTIEEWLAEQRRSVEERRQRSSADDAGRRLTEEEGSRSPLGSEDDDGERMRDRQQVAVGNDGDASSSERTREGGDKFVDPQADDYASRHRPLEMQVDDPGTADKGARRLDDLRRPFLERTRANRGAGEAEEDQVVLDDFEARYQSLGDDVGVASREESGKEARRLDELKRTFLERMRAAEDRRRRESDPLSDPSTAVVGSHGGSSNEGDDYVLDDFESRYQSLDSIASREEDGTRGKEDRRLYELKRTVLERIHTAEERRRQKYQRQSQQQQNDDPAGTDVPRSVDEEEDNVLDDFVARYQPLDIASRYDDGTRGKESRRLDDLKQAFPRNSNSWEEQENDDAYQQSLLDDFASRYDTLEEVATNKDGTSRKETRRLEELKRQASLKNSQTKSYDDEEPLRLDLLERRTNDNEETSIERKELMRIEVLQRRARLSAEKRSQRSKQDENDRGGDGNISGAVGGDAKAYKTNETRRLEELERYFNKRRAARIAEEDRLEQMLADAKLEASLLSMEEEDEKEALDRRLSSEKGYSQEVEENDDMDLDDFFDERPEATASSLSTTMAPSNNSEWKGTEKGSGSVSSSSLIGEKEAMVSEKIWDTSVENTMDRKEDQVSPSNRRGAVAKLIPHRAPDIQKRGKPEQVKENVGGGGRRKAKGKGLDEECIGEECWDITHSPFAERENQSLATTLPPTNTKKDLTAYTSVDVRNSSKEMAEKNKSGEAKRKEVKIGKYDDEECVGEECWDITHSSFAERENRSLATTLPPTNTNVNPVSSIGGRSIRGQKVTEQALRDDDEYQGTSIRTLFPNRRGTTSFRSLATPPSAAARARSLGNNEAFVNATSQKRKKLINDSRTSPPPSPQPSFEEEVQPNRNDKTVASASTVKEDGTHDSRRTIKARSTHPPSSALIEEDESTLNNKAGSASALFQKIQPSPKKELKAEAGSNLGSRKDKKARGPQSSSLKGRGISEMNAGSMLNGPSSNTDPAMRFPKGRPYLSASIRAAKPRGTTGTTARPFEESKRRSAEARQNRESFMSRVNGGPKKRDLTSTGSYLKDGHTNIAQNFSSSRASLLGHLPMKKVNFMAPTSDGNNYLDSRKFSSDLRPSSRVTAATTNALWREGDSASAEKNDETYLDTPRAFAKNLGMVPLTMNTKAVVTEADKKAASVTDQQQFLDTPRPFQSNVDMVSSNTSGAKFKKSSEIPPEEKNIKDYYDITTAPMPSIDGMAMTKVSRKEKVQPEESSKVSQSGKVTTVDGGGKSLFVDNFLVEPSDDNNASNGQPEEPLYEDVMCWILTHLPQLQEEDAVAYYNHLLEDGFDSIDMLVEVLEEDLYFMKRGHQITVLQSMNSVDNDDFSFDSLENDPVDDQKTISTDTTLDNTIDQARKELDKTEAWISEQNRLVDERLAARLTAEDEAE